MQIFMALFPFLHKIMAKVLICRKRKTLKTLVGSNRGREVLARVKLLIDIARELRADIKESAAADFTKVQPDHLAGSHINTFTASPCPTPPIS